MVLCNQIYLVASFDVVGKVKKEFWCSFVLRNAFDAVDAHEYQQVLHKVYLACTCIYIFCKLKVLQIDIVEAEAVCERIYSVL